MYSNFEGALLKKDGGGFSARRQVESDFTQGFDDIPVDRGYAGGYKDKLNNYLAANPGADKMVIYENYFKHMHSKLSSHKGGRAGKNKADWENSFGQLTPAEQKTLLTELYHLDDAGQTKAVVQKMDEFVAAAERAAKNGVPPQYPLVGPNKTQVLQVPYIPSNYVP